ncbi:hypothetical protein P170DRAFT_451772 [Aspergillus steynii IBT 23096]|uniref:Uncharacterized protein n=1 Tax=Aspergillus steynii IBT 23096 TaxID=1392250 RepID=A0A2I2GLL8_9EURO|nr:uncharacterized protein P170DRAFT_451772 [Aspergillus steynii IBT 23096]PLB53765.1 hypothetical protein P170DRAFT_451772 [Aspergillus steynii IBT 23096]
MILFADQPTFTLVIPVKHQSPNTETATTHNNKQHTAQLRNPLNSIDLLNLSQNFRLLPVPEDIDDLEMTSRKMQDLAREVSEGNSLALYTGLKVASQNPRSLDSIAKANLTPYELQQYEHWRKSRDSHDNGCYKNDTMKLPDINWEENVAPVPNGAQSLKKFRQRAEAMDRIWGYQGATPEHASWLTYHLTSMLPLVKAVTKISNLERNTQTNKSYARELTDMEVAELETVRKVVIVAERNRSREMAKVRRLTRSIADSVAIMKSRVHALEKKHGRSL